MEKVFFFYFKKLMTTTQKRGHIVSIKGKKKAFDRVYGNKASTKVNVSFHTSRRNDLKKVKETLIGSMEKKHRQRLMFPFIQVVEMI